MKKNLALKIILSFLPALIFAQNYGWITLYKGFGIALVIIWALCVWLVIKTSDKNKVLSELFRISEIGAFLLPISAIVMTFMVGAKFMSQTTNDAEKVGAAIGTTLGGFLAVGISFVIGLFGGIIFHLLANRFEKKVSVDAESRLETRANFFERHRILTIITITLFLAIIGSVSSSVKNDSGQNKQSEESLTGDDAKTQNISDAKKESQVFKINEPVQVGHFIYIVSRVDDKSEIPTSFKTYKPNGIFKLVFLGAQNIDKESRYLDSSMFKLTDNKGRAYDSSVEGNTAVSMLMKGDNDLFLKQVNPSILVVGAVVFDIPKDAEGLKLELSGGFGSSEKKDVDLESEAVNNEGGKATLGVRFIPIDSKIQAENNLPYPYGALVIKGKNKGEVAVVSDSPAEKAGIKENDIILEVNGIKIDTDNNLTDVIGKYKVGDVVKFKVWQKGEEKEFWVELTEMK